MVNVYRVRILYQAGGERAHHFDDLAEAQAAFKKPLEWYGNVWLDQISAASPAGLLSHPTITELARRHEGL